MNIVLMDSNNVGKDVPIEHTSFMFYIENLSRANLQEISRSRTLSLTVKSSRYTLSKDLKKEDSFIRDIYDFRRDDFYTKDIYDFERASKYILLSDDEVINKALVKDLEELRKLVILNKSDDSVKYAIPECYYTKLVVTIGYDDLVHLCKLRLHKSALKEYRLLMKNIVKAIPEKVNEQYVTLVNSLTKDLNI